MSNPCPCGGETQLEYFDHPNGQQWFMRCSVCPKMSRAVATPEEAATLSIEASLTEKQGDCA